MTVDAAIVVSDSDSDQMEIDMDNNDKDSSRAIDSDIESVKGVRYVVPYTKGSENVDLKKGNENIATDSKTTPNNIKGITLISNLLLFYTIPVIFYFLVSKHSIKYWKQFNFWCFIKTHYLCCVF